MASHDQLNPHSAFNDQAFDDPYLSGPSDLEEFGLGQPQHTPSASSADNLSRLPSSSPADQNLSSDNQMDMFDFDNSPFIGSDFNVPGSNGNLFLEGMLSGGSADQIASFPNLDVGINTKDDFQMVGDGRFSTSAGNYSSRENAIGVNSSAHRPAQPPNLVIPNSTSDNHLGHNRTTSVPPLSPIVKISQVHRGDSPTRESDSGHKRNWSSAHLSPTLGSSEDGDESSQSVETNHSERAYSPTRAEDGSWILNATTGHSGVDPYSRSDEWGPSPSELEERRQRAEKDSDIQKWSASVSVANSESGEEPPLRNSTGRVRSVSAVELRQDYFNLHQPDDVTQSGANRFSDEAGHRIDIDGDLNASHEDSKDYTSEEHQLAQQLNPAYPWKDPARYPLPLAIESQPKTSSSAMQRFEEMAKELDNASRVGTWGSRRLNDAEVDSLLKSDSFFKNLSLNKTSILKLLPKRSSNSVKNKKRNSQHPNPEEEQSDQKPKKESGLAAKLSRRSSFNHPKSPTHIMAMAGQIAASIAGHKTLSVNSQVSSSRASLSPGPHWKGNRFRSKSEGSRTAPTLSPLTIPSSDQPQASSLYKASPQVESRTSIGLDGDDDDDDDFADDKGVLMDSPSSSQQIQPTLDGFKRQITQLYPLLEPALLQRFASEQLSRYKKLVEKQEEHAKLIPTRSCNSGDRCFASGGHAKLLPPRANPRDSNATFCQFRISDTEHSGEEDGDLEHEDEQSIENAIQVAVFPINIPKPPVKRLPAEFECPLCFKVKKLQKPSDWTKHVFEDICPFTCTFAECTSVPKSFKRKADWVRHETECHRHLEWWTCNEHNCPHQCFRKNNFVQHLVREHGKPDPTAKKSKAATAASGSHNAQQIQELWQQVEECHFETDKKPEDEPCRFCSKVYKDWKHLMGHLASHMKRIALPVLRVAEERTSPAASTNHTADIHNVPSVAAAAPAISVYAESEYDPNAGVLSELEDDQISEDIMTSSMQPTTLSTFDGHNHQSSNMYSGGTMRMDMSPGGTTYPPASTTFYLQPHYVPQQRNSMSYPPSPVSNSMAIGQTTVANPGGNNNHLSQAAIYNHQGQSMLANSTTIGLNDSREVLYQSPQDTNFNPEDHFPLPTTTSSAVGYASTHNINYPVSTSMQTVNTMVAVNHSVYMPQTLMVSQIQDDNNRYASATYPYQ